MFIKLAWRVVASGALILCVGCGSSRRESTASCDPGTAPVCTPTCAPGGPAPANEAALATRDRLLRKAVADGPEKLALGDALRDLGEYNSAETSYFGALSRGGLTADESYRAQMGLAQCADAQNQNYSARSRYKEAWKVAPNDAGEGPRADGAGRGRDRGRRPQVGPRAPPRGHERELRRARRARPAARRRSARPRCGRRSTSRRPAVRPRLRASEDQRARHLERAPDVDARRPRAHGQDHARHAPPHRGRAGRAARPTRPSPSA